MRPRRYAARVDRDHEAAEAFDRRREVYLASCAIHVLRFVNDEVETNLAGVAAEIEAVLDL